MRKILIVTGSRDYVDAWMIAQNLAPFIDPALWLWHGGAAGADTLAGAWAMRHCFPVRVVRADWAQYGKAAGPIRNRAMLLLALSEPRSALHLVAFPKKGELTFPSGTAHMVATAQRALRPEQITIVPHRFLYKRRIPDTP